jgi:hypothetical protein
VGSMWTPLVIFEKTFQRSEETRKCQRKNLIGLNRMSMSVL